MKLFKLMISYFIFGDHEYILAYLSKSDGMILCSLWWKLTCAQYYFLLALMNTTNSSIIEKNELHW
jgi:hypothetical protein